MPTPLAPEQALRSLVRWRLVFLALAVLVPAGCQLVFERQARRLDALADHGAATTATVTSVNGEGDVGYAYEVAAQRYTWSVGPGAAPRDVGASFPIAYLPEDPSFSRPGADSAKAAVEASSNRRLAGRFVLGVVGFFLANLLLVELRLRRLRKTGLLELDDPQAYRTRLAVTGAMVLAMLVGITSWHVADAREHGEAAWPPLVAALLALALVGGIGWSVLREGPRRAGERSARLLRWVAPLAILVALARAIAWMLDVSR